MPSGEPVLTTQVARLARVVADRYAGTLSDVLRLALPPRRGAPEKRPTPTPDALPGPPDPAGFARYRAGAALLTALAEGHSPRAVWNALPGEDWPARLAELCRAALSAGRGSLVVVWDDGDDLHADEHAPYPHARDVLVQRAYLDAVSYTHLTLPTTSRV